MGMSRLSKLKDTLKGTKYGIRRCGRNPNRQQFSDGSKYLKVSLRRNLSPKQSTHFGLYLNLKNGNSIHYTSVDDVIKTVNLLKSMV